MIVVATGCPAGVGPEVALKGAARLRGVEVVLVGDEQVLLDAADLVGVPRRRLRRWGGQGLGGGLYLHPAGPPLGARDRIAGHPSARAGEAQLAYLEAAYELCRQHSACLATGPVSKQAIARSGLARARHFRGHTEWLCDLDRAPEATMCFWCRQLATSLVTTHVSLKLVSRSIRASGVDRATRHLALLLQRLTIQHPRVVVASLNPHAAEGGLLGAEEREEIVPGIRAAKRKLRGGADISGPLGAETAYRLTAGGTYDGVVAMYHDQATIPMKLLAFGEAVNVTMGLSIVRTSVDHGTAYDIAWQGVADASGMFNALRLAHRLAAKP